MVRADEFAWISAVLSEFTPGADIGRVELKGGGAERRVVTVATRTPGELIGRRGATADAIRAALAQRFADERLQLNILEIPEDPPPSRGPADGPGSAFPPL